MVRDTRLHIFPTSIAAAALCLSLVVGLCLAAALALPALASAAGPGPVAAYSFDEGEGTTVEDVTGDGHTGTIEAPAKWTAHGKYGDALEFGGNEGGCVTVPGSPALGEEFTAEAWVKSKYLGNEPVFYEEDEGSFGYALGIGLHEFGKAEAWISDGEGVRWKWSRPTRSNSESGPTSP